MKYLQIFQETGMKTLYIGMGGRAHSGKTTTAEAMQEEARLLGLNARIYSFSDEILAFCIAEGRLPKGITRPELTSTQLIELIEAGREFREVDPFFWLKRLDLKIAADAPDVALVPNLRYHHESDWFRDKEGFVVKCVRFNLDGTLYIADDRPANDESETNADTLDADFFITVRTGGEALVAEYAATIFHFIYALETGEHD